MPFAGYENFDECVAKNGDQDDPDAYCATIMRQVEGKAKAGDVVLQKRIGEHSVKVYENPTGGFFSTIDDGRALTLMPSPESALEIAKKQLTQKSRKTILVKAWKAVKADVDRKLPADWDYKDEEIMRNLRGEAAREYAMLRYRNHGRQEAPDILESQSDRFKAREVGGFESPEPGNIPEKKKRQLAEVYASCRKDGGSKESCAKQAWSATNKAKPKPIEEHGWLQCPMCKKEFYGEMDYDRHLCEGKKKAGKLMPPKYIYRPVGEMNKQELKETEAQYFNVKALKWKDVPAGNKICPACGGLGKRMGPVGPSSDTCAQCQGTGLIKLQPGQKSKGVQACPNCAGSGRESGSSDPRQSNTCPRCGGRGVILAPDEKKNEQVHGKSQKARYIGGRKEGADTIVTLELDNGKRIEVRGSGADLDRKLAEIAEKEQREAFEKDPRTPKLREDWKKLQALRQQKADRIPDFVERMLKEGADDSEIVRNIEARISVTHSDAQAILGGAKNALGMKAGEGKNEFRGFVHQDFEVGDKVRIENGTYAGKEGVISAANHPNYEVNLNGYKRVVHSMDLQKKAGVAQKAQGTCDYCGKVGQTYPFKFNTPSRDAHGVRTHDRFDVNLCFNCLHDAEIKQKAGVAQLPADQTKFVDGGDETQNPKRTKAHINRQQFMSSWESALKENGGKPITRKQIKDIAQKLGVGEEAVINYADDEGMRWGNKSTSLKSKLASMWKKAKAGIGALPTDKEVNDIARKKYGKLIPQLTDRELESIYKELGYSKLDKAEPSSEFEKEQAEHPSFSEDQIVQIVEDHEAEKAQNTPACPDCGVALKYNGYGSYVCPECKLIYNEEELDFEKKASHKCETCGKFFMSDQQLKHHIELRHDKKYQESLEEMNSKHSKEISHGSLPTERLARHTQMKEYAEIEAAFLKEGDWHTGGIPYRYDWDTIERCKDSFKGREFFIGHNEQSGLEYGLIKDVSTKDINGEKWAVAKIRVPESGFTKDLLARIENGLVRYVSTTHSFFVDPNDPSRTVQTIKGKAISTVLEPEVDGAKILGCIRHIRGKGLNSAG